MWKVSRAVGAAARRGGYSQQPITRDGLCHLPARVVDHSLSRQFAEHDLSHLIWVIISRHPQTMREAMGVEGGARCFVFLLNMYFRCYFPIDGVHLLTTCHTFMSCTIQSTTYRRRKCVFACLGYNVTYVGHRCPAVWHAHSCGGGVFVMSCCV